MWDAIGSIGIGVLLGGIATFLVSKNRQLLIGRSMNPREVQVRACRAGGLGLCLERVWLHPLLAMLLSQLSGSCWHSCLCSQPWRG